jgi:hypothetical protein
MRLMRSPCRREREKVRDTTLKGGTKNCFSGFEDSQAVPARPSGRDMLERR